MVKVSIVQQTHTLTIALTRVASMIWNGLEFFPEIKVQVDELKDKEGLAPMNFLPLIAGERNKVV